MLCWFVGWCVLFWCIVCLFALSVCVNLYWFIMLCGLFRVLCVACFLLYRVFCLCMCRKRPDVSVVLCYVFGVVLLFGLLCVALFWVLLFCDVLFARV